MNCDRGLSRSDGSEGPSGPILVACDRFFNILIIKKMDHRAQKWLVSNLFSWKWRFFFIFGRFCKTMTLRIPLLFGFGENVVKSDHLVILTDIVPQWYYHYWSSRWLWRHFKKTKKIVISRFLVFEFAFFKYEKPRFFPFFLK